MLVTVSYVIHKFIKVYDVHDKKFAQWADPDCVQTTAADDKCMLRYCE